MKLKLLLLITAIIWSGANGAKYFFYMPFVPKSMALTTIPIIEGLTERGHEVTLLTPESVIDDKIKNAKEIVIESNFKKLFDTVRYIDKLQHHVKCKHNYSVAISQYANH